MSWVRGQPIVGTPKSAAGTREVSVPPHIVPALEQHLEKHVRPGANALLFPSVRDHQRHLQPTVLHTAWRKARAAAGREDLQDPRPAAHRRHHGRHDRRHPRRAAGSARPLDRAAALRYQHAAQGRDAEIAAKLSDLARARHEPR